MTTAIEKQKKFCDDMDKAHIFDCPHCETQTNKFVSQDSCQHCDGKISHSLTFYGHYITKKT